MPIGDKVKKTIKGFDLFAQPITFRFGDQPMYQSVTGGICSIVMIIVFAAIFTNTVISTFRKENISSTITTLQEQDPSYYKVGTNNFMFALGLTGISYKNSIQYFSIYMQKVDQTPTKKAKADIPLGLCTKSQWTRINNTFDNVYDRLGFGGWLCPPDGTVVQLQGKYSSDMFKYYKIGVVACTAATAAAFNQTCATAAQITSFISANQAFQLNFYYVNTIINANNKDYIQLYLDDTNYFPFTITNGMNANFFLSSYKINNDESIWPIQQNDSVEGGINNVPTQTINYQFVSGDYAKLYIRKSSLSLTIQRTFRKIDDTLSYIGGLFSTLIVLLALLSLYNEYSYELDIAQNLYHYQKNTPLDAKTFNFFVFFGFLIYVGFEKIGVDLPWKRMRTYFNSIQQCKKQMDIRLIMKKISYTERMAIAVFDQPKAKILHLQEPMTLQEAQKIRKNHRFYEKLQKKFIDYQKIRAEQEQKSSQQKLSIQEKKEQSKIRFEKQLKNDFQNTFPNEIKVPSSKKLPPIISANSIVTQAHMNSKINVSSNKVFDDNMLIKTQENNQNSTPDQTNETLKNILNLFIGEQARKKQEFEQMIQQTKNNLKILKKQAQEGDIVSKKILQRFDPKLRQVFYGTQAKRRDPEIEQAIDRQNKEKIVIESLPRIESNQSVPQMNIFLQMLRKSPKKKSAQSSQIIRENTIEKNNQ